VRPERCGCAYGKASGLRVPSEEAGEGAIRRSRATRGEQAHRIAPSRIGSAARARYPLRLGGLPVTPAVLARGAGGVAVLTQQDLTIQWPALAVASALAMRASGSRSADRGACARGRRCRRQNGDQTTSRMRSIDHRPSVHTRGSREARCGQRAGSKMERQDAGSGPGARWRTVIDLWASKLGLRRHRWQAQLTHRVGPVSSWGHLWARRSSRQSHPSGRPPIPWRAA